MHLFVLVLVVCVVGSVVVTIFSKLGSVVLLCSICCIVLFIVVHTVYLPSSPARTGGDGK